jgi:transposase InsO family protein
VIRFGIPMRPTQLWVADMTHVTVIGGFAYVAVVLDAWSRRVVGYAISRSIDVRLTLAALASQINTSSIHTGNSLLAVRGRRCVNHGQVFVDAWPGGTARYGTGVADAGS